MINVDAALFNSSNCMGAGVVIRNNVGDFAGACGDCIHNVSSPELAEALAIRSAVIFASEEGMDNLIIASDCLSVVQRLNAKGMDRSASGPVILDIKSMMASFSACSIRHVSHLQNVAAHHLARSLELSRRFVWRCVPPECIRETLCIDIMSGD
jgi:ribonuclease HI